MQDFQKNVEYPLDDKQHARIREAIVKEATRTLVARYFIEIFGPLGAGLETVSFETYAADELAKIDLEGGIDAKIATPREEVYRRVPTSTRTSSSTGATLTSRARTAHPST